ncbi:hypothetical protein [Actinomycetospora chiangmaiensis]|uniref:hypothetical protein n=1 Tax=Actinomycetospora chiangmaiensis TaxID=402650 RepID=UPI0003678917|nr:hypothetical protein [Actinomycetospora chiangmaiensis]
MDERRTEGFTDPLAGPDGTGPTRRDGDPTTAASPPSDLRLPGATDPDGVARWMDEDRSRALRPSARDVPPPRPIPQPRPERVLPPEYVESTSTAPVSGDGESAWQRERREEAEFRAQFGEWRAGAPRRADVGATGMGPRSAGLLGGVKLGAPLIVLIAVLIAVFALALHL